MAAFLVPATYSPPILGGPAELPAALYRDASPYVFAARPEPASVCAVAGAIAGDSTWSPARCGAYLVADDVTIEPGATLTITAGTLVRFALGKTLTVNGTLVARGTANSPITFTSDADTPAAGNWGHLAFAGASAGATLDQSGQYAGGSILQHVLVEYGGSEGGALPGALRLEAAAPYLDHITVQRNLGPGVYVQDGVGLHLGNSVIRDNRGAGLDATLSSGAAVISGNTIRDNDSFGISLANGQATIERNLVTANGGTGVLVTACGATIRDNTVSDNQGNFAGGVYAGCGAVVSGNTVSGNRSAASGGGIVAESDAVVTGNVIAGNVAWNGGGVYLAGDGQHVAANLIIANTAQGSAVSGNGQGGGIFAGGSGTTIVSNTIRSNTAYYGGGISHNGAPDGDVHANTITGNVAASQGGGIWLSSLLSLTGNDIYDNVSGSGETTQPDDLVCYSGVFTVVDARDGYRGTTDAAVIGPHISPNTTGTGVVEYIPFRTQPLSFAASALAVDGSGAGMMGRSYTFTASVSPRNASLPISYEWQAAGQSPVTHSDVWNVVDTCPFTWTSPGSQLVTVTATNRAGTLSSGHSITIRAGLYMPLVVRNH